MDADDSYPYLSEKDIIYELFSQHYPVLKGQELEAGYAACTKYTAIARDPNVLRLQFDCATRLGYKDEAVQIALLASAQSEVTAEMYFALGEYFYGQKDLLRAWDNLRKAIAVAPESKHLDRQNIVVRSLILLADVKSSLSLLENTSTQHKKKAYESTRQHDRASSSHTMESEKEQRTMASLASSLTEDFQQAAPSQFEIVYLPLPVPMRVADDMEMEVGKGEKSIFLYSSNSDQLRYGCDWYELDLVKKECSNIFARLEWGGISTAHFGVVAVGSIIYILGGVYPGGYCHRSHPDWVFCNDVFYLDVHHPQDGWKVGPQLPSPHFKPVATSMNETIYIFNGKYVFASALYTGDSGSGWKFLAESPNLELPSDRRFQMAFPDPVRDRILLVSYDKVFFAYYPRKEKLECINSEFKRHPGGISFASAIVDGVLYHNEEDSHQLLWAYDLDQRKMLTPVYHVNIAAPLDYFLYRYWKHLVDLGGGKLCLVGHHWGPKEGLLFLKLKVRKEAGGDKVHITVLSLDTFWVLEDIRFMCSVAL